MGIGEDPEELAEDRRLEQEQWRRDFAETLEALAGQLKRLASRDSCHSLPDHCHINLTMPIRRDQLEPLLLALSVSGVGDEADIPEIGDFIFPDDAGWPFRVKFYRGEMRYWLHTLVSAPGSKTGQIWRRFHPLDLDHWRHLLKKALPKSKAAEHMVHDIERAPIIPGVGS